MPRFVFSRLPETVSEILTIQRERADQPDVAALLASLDDYLATLYPPEANHIMDIASLLQTDVTFLVAREAGRAVGTGAYRRMPGEPETTGTPYGEVKRMYVDPALRGRRLGVRLLAALEDAMRADGLSLALLETGREQTEAVRLYERAGYAERGAFGGYPDNGLSVFYAKPLP